MAACVSSDVVTTVCFTVMRSTPSTPVHASARFSDLLPRRSSSIDSTTSSPMRLMALKSASRCAVGRPQRFWPIVPAKPSGSSVSIQASMRSLNSTKYCG
ncbi:hypothetical protein D3C71_1942980 [compost metagenome]